MSISSIIALAIATIIPLAVLVFIRSRDQYRTGSFWMVLVSFIWGTVVYLVVAQINGWLLGNTTLEWNIIAQLIAPIEEEILKAAILIYLYRKMNFTTFVNGAIYGFAIGIGFAVVENYEYIFYNQDSALIIAISRVISTNLMHAAATAMVGIAFGFARFYKLPRQILTILSGLLVALTIHIGYNNLVTRVSSGMLLIYAAAVGLTVTAIIFFAIRRGMKNAKSWIDEKLGAADRVTGSEARLAKDIKDAKHLLEPLTELFGKEKAAEVHQFLLIQARLGIHRKNLDKFEDQALIDQTEAEINKLQGEMDTIRRSVGTYSMTVVRTLFPPDNSPLWGQLEDTIADRIKAAPAKPGGGLWGALEKSSAGSGTSKSTSDE